MTDTTTRFGVAVPKTDRSDAFHPAEDIRAVGFGFDAKAIRFDIGTAAQRASATHIADRLWRDTDGTKQVYYDDGTDWIPVDRRVPTTAMSSGFPAAQDGELVHFYYAPSGQFATRIRWAFAYDSGLGSTWPWEFVGGPPSTQVYDPADGAPTNTWYTTNSPTFVVPRAGYYKVAARAAIFTDINSTAQLALYVSGVQQANIFTLRNNSSGSADTMWIRGEWDLGPLSVGAPITIGALGVGSGVSVAHRRLEVTPYRCQ